MPRVYHSASSAKTRCMRAAAYRYIDHIREPDVTWEEIEAGADVPTRKHSTALGKAMHAVSEKYLQGEPYDAHTRPAKVFAKGIPFLPTRDEWRGLEVEGPIGVYDPEVDAATQGHEHEDGRRITHARWIAGVRWAGFCDARGRVEAPRLGLSGHTILDHKSSADPRQYALTPEELRDDLQASIYAVDYALTNGLGEHEEINLYWVYYPKKSGRAKAVHAITTLAHAREIVAQWAPRAHELDALTDSASAPTNRDACHDYGGCEYRASEGGPCTTKGSLGALIQLRFKQRKPKEKDSKMALPESLKAKIAAQKTRALGAVAPAQVKETETEAPDEVTEGEIPVTVEDAPEEVAPTPKALSVKAPVAGAAEKLAEKAFKLRAARDAAREKLAAAQTALDEVTALFVEAMR